MINAIIIEDEELAALRLKDIILECELDINIDAIIPSVKKSIEYLVMKQPDLIFLDIHLSDGICFNIFENIKINSSIIFTTAYDKYAIKAFKFNSIDYLLKPVSAEELKFSIAKYIENKAKNEINFQDLISSIQSNKNEFKKRFLVQIGNKIKTINADNISMFYASDKAVYLITASNQNLLIDYTLDKLDNILDDEKFFRINRKMIINLSSIKSMEAYSRGRILIKLNQELPAGIESIVSIDRSNEFKCWLNK